MKIKRLLCVDDDNITLTLIKLVVEKTAFAEEIITKRNGKEALDYFNELLQNNATEYAPDLVFLDLNMPVMNGWDFLDEFQNSFYQTFTNTSIIILSSSTDQAEKIRTLNYPMIVDYITKPLTLGSLANLRI